MTSKKTALTLALGTAIAAALAAAPVSAAGNPFASASLDKGYMVAAAEGKCGGVKPVEAKCGAKAKAKEGKCGYGMLDADKDGKVSKDEFMKGHEAMFNKSDSNKDGFVDSAEMSKMRGMEGNCGGMKGKGMEGKCGGMK